MNDEKYLVVEAEIMLRVFASDLDAAGGDVRQAVQNLIGHTGAEVREVDVVANTP